MITASHLPFNRNGFKFFTGEGGFEKADIKEVLALAATAHEEAAREEVKSVFFFHFFSFSFFFYEKKSKRKKTHVFFSSCFLRN